MKKINIKKMLVRNLKVIENYFFMTALQIISSLFGILIYPYLIRVLGAESYGLYVFSLSITTYFIGFISFGFNFPAVKAIAENKNNKQVKSDVLSSILTAKIYLAVLSTIIFLILLFSIPFMHENKLIIIISYSQIIGEILFPQWYFQGIQKMKIVTYIQLAIRLLSLPFIFIFIKTPNDCWIYALTTALSVIFGGILSIIYIQRLENVTIRFVSTSSLKSLFRDAMPFFWSSAVGTIKQESVTMIIGSFFGMRDVAFYDLANKLIIIPRMLTTSINGALFPKIIENVHKSVVKRIIQYETLIGFGVIACIILLGRFAILLLGGTAMLDSYPMAIILSVTILTWLVVGSYISFIFVPSNHYYLVTQNQLVAFFSFFLFCISGAFFFHNILTIVVALTLSGLCEIAFCNYQIKKHHLL
ncbi:MAG: oligosaccharide flippase family protein [Bacteroidota bacterium]|nr:oligosaccharide flippase family protein [Bacteroidota bacterium]